jgi:hypothetical protein
MLRVQNLMLPSSQVLGNSDKYNPPNAITLDHCPKCSRPNPRSGSASGPEIHVHLEGLRDVLHFGGSVLGNRTSGHAIESTFTGSSKQGTKCASLI